MQSAKVAQFESINTRPINTNLVISGWELVTVEFQVSSTYKSSTDTQDQLNVELWNTW